MRLSALSVKCGRAEEKKRADNTNTSGLFFVCGGNSARRSGAWPAASITSASRGRASAAANGLRSLPGNSGRASGCVPLSLHLPSARLHCALRVRCSAFASHSIGNSSISSSHAPTQALTPRPRASGMASQPTSGMARTL